MNAMLMITADETAIGKVRIMMENKWEELLKL